LITLWIGLQKYYIVYCPHKKMHLPIHLDQDYNFSHYHSLFACDEWNSGALSMSIFSHVEFCLLLYIHPVDPLTIDIEYVRRSVISPSLYHSWQLDVNIKGE
jgi:hypothetical protein